MLYSRIHKMHHYDRRNCRRPVAPTIAYPQLQVPTLSAECSLCSNHHEARPIKRKKRNDTESFQWLFKAGACNERRDTRSMAVDERSEVSFSIPQGTLPWQPILWAKSTSSPNIWLECACACRPQDVGVGLQTCYSVVFLTTSVLEAI